MLPDEYCICIIFSLGRSAHQPEYEWPGLPDFAEYPVDPIEHKSSIFDDNFFSQFSMITNEPLHEKHFDIVPSKALR